MYYAILSDIHSNLEALETVLKALKNKKPDQIISPGDIVGYGADPCECLDLVLERFTSVVMGNHDEAVENNLLRSHFNDYAREAIIWTEGVLKEHQKKKIREWTRMVIDSENGVTLVHGSPDEVEKHKYLLTSWDTRASFEAFQTPVCFIGHTHVPSLFSSSGQACYLKAGHHQLDRRERYILNPGSVGQPRDQNTETSFALFDSQKFEFEVVRLPYDNWKAAEKIKRVGLPAFLGDRLL